MANELSQRLRVVEEARKWIGTPYHHRASVKGHGCDCAQLLVNAFSAAGLIEHFNPAVYSMDWHLHRGEEKYLGEVERLLTRVDDDCRSILERGPDVHFEPGEVLMFRLGRTYSHSALVTEWPYMVHAYAPAHVVEECRIFGTPMASRPTLVYSYWRNS